MMLTTTKTAAAADRPPLLDVCAIAHAGFAEIEALAQAALLALESPTAWRDPEWLAGVLAAIKGAATHHDDAIAWQAEERGASAAYATTEASQRRRQALDAARMAATTATAPSTSRQEARK